MSYRWSGLYLRVDKKTFSSLLPPILENRGYSILEAFQTYNHQVAMELAEKNLIWAGELFDPIFFINADEEWIRVIGLEEIDVCQPRLIFNSEIINQLGCDAFECGYYENDPDIWWYVYYKNGVAEDRFQSHIDEWFDIVRINSDGPLDPLDPIGFYINNMRESDIEIDSHLIPLPADLIGEYIGEPAKFADLIKVKDPSSVERILSITDPISAISQLSETFTLPYIGEFAKKQLGKIK